MATPLMNSSSRQRSPNQTSNNDRLNKSDCIVSRDTSSRWIYPEKKANITSAHIVMYTYAWIKRKTVLLSTTL